MLAAVLLDSADRDAATMVGDLPDEVTCDAEVAVSDVSGTPQGVVDLIFRSPDGTQALLVELKLHSGYGHEQIPRYLRALPAQAPRGGVLAVTRDPPGYGEPTSGTPGWLGSTRWGHILGALGELRHCDDEVYRAWLTLLDILDEEGDFGVTTIDREAVSGWAHFVRGRRQLEGLLRSIAQPTLRAVHDALSGGGGGRPADEHAQFLTRGKQGLIVFPYQDRIFLRIAIPSRGSERLRVQFLALDGRGPFFTVEARHENAASLPETARRALHEKIEPALSHCFDTDQRTYWAHVYGPEQWLDGPDEQLPERLLEFARSDVQDLARSGIFDADRGLLAEAPQPAPPPMDPATLALPDLTPGDDA